MRKVAQFLHVASRVLAICAVLAGLAPGLLTAMFRGFVCFDTCTTREFYFSYAGPTAVRVMTPCVVLELLALAVFLAYCLATRQARRAVIALLFLLVGGLVGGGVLNALLQHAQATLPVEEDGVLVRGPVEAWVGLWGLSLGLVASTWSGVFARMQWRR